MLSNPGLCGACKYSKVISSSRGSRFILCLMSTVDPAYPKYPNLPVNSCAGFVSRPEANEG